ncbi:polyphenol oxidase family protein [Cellulomonas sp. PhB143]|uniref:polyphenol oxidase family protein n=1 Tax=Cellulomonas sp. PhB143 TaxID=2485186 RepID=UPI000F494DA0|nr:polyphenol oxidase family protein [Cellulomonas sp. PhB143]ROS77217.1 hypothetical protein EDF32_1215 [Cellulomonas sp. PhB143]
MLDEPETRTGGAVAPPVRVVDLGPGVRAGFTTRDGGVSAAPWDALNLGRGVGDAPADVTENRARVAAWLGAVPRFGRQVHGAVAVRADAEPWAGGGAAAPEPACDALVSATPSVALGVLVADCVPVLLADPVARVVATAHAGRAGLVAGVLGAAVEGMLAAGARRQHLRAAVGPAVCGRCYEVPAALRDEVAADVPATWATTSWGTPSLDLPAGVVAGLGALGVHGVTRVEACTRTDPTWFSHRRASAAGSATGRFAGVVALR